eukprot:tig00000767_g3967.t1
MGVALLAFDLASIAPPGFTHLAGTIYKQLPWPGAKGSSYADAYLPPASIVELRADGRTEEGGPLRYHALVRLPFFPTAPTSCPFELVGATVCPGLDIVHVTAIFTWAVDESALQERASATDASYKYRSGVVVHGAPTVLRTDTLPLSQHWIVQNERPLLAGRGFGYLEVFRVAKADAYQSGMAGRLDGSVRIFGASTWRGNLSEWTSVAAAAYKDGVLYIVRELHSASSQHTFVFATSDNPRPRLVKERRLHRSNERATSSQLVLVRGVDGPTFDAASVKASIAISDWVANVVGAYTIEDYSAFNSSNLEVDAAILRSTSRVPELPVVVFVVSEPATLISLHTNCPPGTVWNAAAATFKRSVSVKDLCTPLPPGLFTARSGTILESEAERCPEGTYSTGGATECSRCPVGTWSEAGSSACYGCPLNEFSLEEGMRCTPCETGAFTLREGWTAQCPKCFAGSFLKDENGRKSCRSCPGGQFATYGTVDSCSLCPGTYRPPTSTICLPVGERSVALVGSSSFSVCVDGSVPNIERSECLKCPKGTYRAENMSRCEPVPHKAVSVADRSWFRPCERGWVANNIATMCVPCPKGSYEDDGACRACAPNTVAPFESMTV